MSIVDLQPTLKGQLLELRPLSRTDFESLYAAASDPLIWEQHPERNRFKKDVFEGFFLAAIASKGAFAAIDRSSNRVIGSSRFTAYDHSNRRVEIGYTFLERSYWGKGFNQEMKNLMLNHAFQFVNEVHFYIGEENFRSRRAIEKLGAEFVERLDRQPKEGAKYTAVIYRLNRASSVL